MNILVSAGGQGTKIWPFSRKSSPKQFQKIIGEDSSFSHNIKMLLTKYKPENIFISTKKMYKEIVSEQARSIPTKNIILEPDSAQGRGPGEGFAFLYLSIHAPNEPFSILQSDCIYITPENYLNMLEDLDNLVKKENKFISGGQVPAFPVLGVDYLELGESVNNHSNIFKVKNFLGRKEDYKETEKLISENKVVIHMNINTWYPELMLEAYKKYKLAWYDSLMKIKEVIDDAQAVEEIFNKMEKGSTEEVTQNIFKDGYIVIPSFKWIDLGTWDSIYRHFSQEGDLYTEGNVVALDSSGSLIKSLNPKKLIAVLGLKNMVVVDTDDILFISPRDKVNNIKKVQEKLKNSGLEEYL